MYRRVIVPLDGSALAETILPFIEQIAGPLDMEVILVHVVPLTPVKLLTAGDQARAGSPVDKELEAQGFLKEIEAQGYLESLVDRLVAKGVRAGARVRIGHPPGEIVAAAKELDADLIAMTTHGRSGLGRLLFGSVAEAVLRSSPVPVFLMRMTEAALAAGKGKRS